MIDLKSTANGIKIDYTLGDTFKFVLKGPARFKDGTKALLEISPGGGEPLISKEYIPNANVIEVSLTDEEASRLKVSRNHLFKIVLVSNDNKKSIVSGNIKIK